MSSYWVKRLNRRRFVVGASALAGAGAALALAGCSDNGSSGRPASSSSLIVEAKDTSAQAKRGGIYLSVTAGDENNLDPTTTPRGAGLGGPGRGAYSRLLREKDEPGGRAKPEFLGDFAESWELSDGGLRLSVKLRKDAKLDPRAPTNGRALNATDVLYSYERLSTLSSYSTQLSNKADPASPVLSVQKVDDHTVNFNLAFPWVPLFPTLADGTFFIVPVEGDGKFKLEAETRGSGPWMLTEYQRSAYFNWRKNPNWFRKNELPFLDGYDQPILAEPAAVEAQFRTKRIYDYLPKRSSVLTLAKELPGVQLRQSRPDSESLMVFFGAENNPPFKDVRVRRAVSMALDRDLFARVDSEADLFEAAGIRDDMDPDTHLPAYFKDAGLWLDSRGSALGDGSKYFKKDLTEAKKLLTAAGFPNGFDIPGPFRGGLSEAEKLQSIVSEWVGEIGIHVKLQPVDYQTVWLQGIFVAPAGQKGKYSGLSSHRFGLAQFDPGIALYIRHHSLGAFTGSRAWDDGQKEVDSVIEKSLQEFDEGKRKSLIQDAQKKMAVYMSDIALGYSTRRYSVVWPWVQNWGFASSFYSVGGADVPYLYTWIDESQKT